MSSIRPIKNIKVAAIKMPTVLLLASKNGVAPASAAAYIAIPPTLGTGDL